MYAQFKSSDLYATSRAFFRAVSTAPARSLASFATFCRRSSAVLAGSSRHAESGPLQELGERRSADAEVRLARVLLGLHRAGADRSFRDFTEPAV